MSSGYIGAAAAAAHLSSDTVGAIGGTTTIPAPPYPGCISHTVQFGEYLMIHTTEGLFRLSHGASEAVKIKFAKA
jgi:hypothetical protein